MNKLHFNSLDANFSRDYPQGMIVKSTKIEDFLNSNDVAKKIISYWVERDKNGYMSMDRIAERGLYNATDNDVNISKSSKEAMQY